MVDICYDRLRLKDNPAVTFRFRTGIPPLSPNVNRPSLPALIRFLERSPLGRSALRTIRRVRSRPQRDGAKVLCIGNLKTGTSSFGMAMRRLGFSHFGFDHDMYHGWLADGQVERCLKFAEAFDSFDDRPWSDPRLVGAFACYFPGTRFVLLEREVTAWMASWRTHFLRLGCPDGRSDDELFHYYHEHNQQVIAAIADQGSLLRMNVCAGDGYELLCPFLGLPVLQESFPRENTTRRTPQ